MKIASLRAKARKNSLEVEHMLAAAKARLPGLRDELRRLTQELDWSNSKYLADGTHVVPFAKWAEVAGAYAEGGIDSLATLAQEQQNAGYIIGMLEELRSLEALDALTTFFGGTMRNPSSDPDIAWRLAGAYNQLLCFKGSPTPTDAQANLVRTFLMSLFPIATSDTQRALVVYALRGVGDQSSLDFLSGIGELPYPDALAKSSAVRAIRKRLLA